MQSGSVWSAALSRCGRQMLLVRFILAAEGLWVHGVRAKVSRQRGIEEHTVWEPALRPICRPEPQGDFRPYPPVSCCPVSGVADLCTWPPGGKEGVDDESQDG